jgi:hypothetical protein
MAQVCAAQRPSAGGVEVTITCADPLAVECAGPVQPSTGDGAPGGLDAGLVGDSDRILLGTASVAKTWYGANDSATVYFIGVGPITVEIGHMPYEFGARHGEVLVDGAAVAQFEAHRPAAESAVVTVELAATGAVQSLTVRPADDGGYVVLDAIRFRAGSPVRIVDRQGRPALIASGALAPSAVAAISGRMTREANLATRASGLTYSATEEWKSNPGTTSPYSALAVLDGDPSPDNYWAGGTAPPHALVLRWPRPITFDTNRIIWLGTNRGVWYTLEYWDGTRWRVVYEERRNVQVEPVYRVAPITTDQLRLTILSVIGQQRVLMTAFELYNLAGGAGQ